MRTSVYLLTAGIFLIASSVDAHYNMLLPVSASGKKGEAMAFTYQFGHPFEHQLFDAPAPERVTVCTPDGKTQDLTKTLTKVALPVGDGKTVTGYRFNFTPQTRGDFIFVLQTPPIWMAEDGEYLSDTVKVIFHVQSQRGWGTLVQEDFEWQPLTRPYGLEPGMVFQAKLDTKIRPANTCDTLAEIERMNDVAPKTLPPDEQITRTAKPDPNGVVTCTLTDPGWWAITGIRPHGTHKHDGKEVPLKQRTTLWVFVDKKAK